VLIVIVEQDTMNDIINTQTIKKENKGKEETIMIVHIFDKRLLIHYVYVIISNRRKRMFRSVNSNAEITDVPLLIYINTYGFLLYAYFEIEKHYKKKRPVPNMYIISIYFSNRSYRASMGYTYIY